MGEPNGTKSIHIDNHFGKTDANNSGSSSSCGQTTGPTGQREAIIQATGRLQYNRNSDIMNKIEEWKGISIGSTTAPLPRTRTTRSTVATKPRDDSIESLFGTQRNTNTSHTSNTSNTTNSTTIRMNSSSGAALVGIDSTGNGLEVGLEVGRGRHRLQHNTTRPDLHSVVGSALAAPVVPVSQSSSEPNSAFDNKAFSCDGERVLDLVHTIHPSHRSHGSHAYALTHTTIATNCGHSTTTATITAITANNTTSRAISDELNTSDNNNHISSDDCILDSNNRKNSDFMITQNDSDSALKGQYCSQSDDRRQVLRGRSTRSQRSARSSVVKHIGVFYSDLCDVIKAMRSGTNTTHIIHTNNNNTINNTNNTSNNNGSAHSTAPHTPHTPPQSQPIGAHNHHRTNISAPVLLLQNEHLVNASVPVSPQPSQPTQPSQPSHPYPTQPQPQSIPCLQASHMSGHSIAGQTTLRSPSQTQIRLNENHIHDLPDILNSHLPPPPYSTLPPPHVQLPPLSSLPPLAPIRAPPPPPPPPPLPTGRPPLPSRRILHTPSGALVGHCSRPNYLRPTCAVSETETSASKTCLSCNGVSIRWFILLIAFIGLLCSIVGTILGALRTTGREHLTLALLMIGVGIILITVSGIAWRLTSTGPTWRSILGLHELHQQQSLCNGSSINEASRRFVPRVPAPYGRTGTHHHPYGAMFYPEFQYRPPPPSYQASMQEYRLRLLLLDRSSSHPQSTSLSPVSPPPTYRSSAASSLTGTLPRQPQSNANTIQRPPNRPPSYRPVVSGDGQPLVSSTPLYQSTTTQTVAQPTLGSPTAIRPAPTPMSTILTTSHTQTQPSKSLTQKPCHHSSHHDINRVTILQTTNTSQVCTPNGVNIVAISPTSIMAANTPTTTSTTTIPTLCSAPVVSSNEVHILAHV